MFFRVASLALSKAPKDQMSESHAYSALVCSRISSWQPHIPWEWPICYAKCFILILFVLPWLSDKLLVVYSYAIYPYHSELLRWHWNNGRISQHLERSPEGHEWNQMATGTKQKHNAQRSNWIAVFILIECVQISKLSKMKMPRGDMFKNEILFGFNWSTIVKSFHFLFQKAQPYIFRVLFKSLQTIWQLRWML